MSLAASWVCDFCVGIFVDFFGVAENEKTTVKPTVFWGCLLFLTHTRLFITALQNRYPRDQHKSPVLNVCACSNPYSKHVCPHCHSAVTSKQAAICPRGHVETEEPLRGRRSIGRNEWSPR